MPDYSSELGFIHHVVADLKRVFETLQGKKMVIFIDDLDRCSPQKVAEVMEGINLFLAGDFRQCMFILGMDTDMVAAALESAHESIIRNLPADSSIPIGWRFMDKFVTIPFIIPPAEKSDLEKYANELLQAEEKDKISDEKVISRIGDLFKDLINYSEEDLVEQFSNVAKDIPEEMVMQAKDDVLFKYRIEKLETITKNFNNKNPEIRSRIVTMATKFSDNPRDLKRFINVYRLQYFLREAQVARGLRNVVSLQQLQRWVFLTMKWPEVVRWIQHCGGIDMHKARLYQLEEMGTNAFSMKIWQDNALKIALLDYNKVRWLNDDSLRQFFLEESCIGEGARLSDGSGKGLW
jgi:hypothetical protein